MRRGRPPHDDILTPREWEVVALLREGLTNAQIGERLGISLNTVKFHISEILSKLGLTTRDEAMAWAEHNRPRGLHGLGLAALLAHKSALLKAGLGSAAAITVVGAVILFAAALSSRQDPAGPLGKLAYIAEGNLWVKDLTSGRAQQLTFDGGAANPEWSASGDWIAFYRTPLADSDQRGVWVVRDDGSGERRVAEQGQVAWSPVADVLAFTVPAGPLYLGASVLVTEKADGSGRRELLPSLPGDGSLDRRSKLAWSSDGAWIVFQEDHQDHQSQYGGFGYVGLRAVRSDGSDEHEIYAAEVPPPDSFLGIDLMPALASVSGGGGASFVSLAPDAATPAEAGGLPTRLMMLFTRSPEGSGVHMLAYRDFMDLSPDGRELALVAGVDLQTFPPPAGTTSQVPPMDVQDDKTIVVMDLGTGAVRRLTGNDVVAVSPAWSWDGKHIVYVARPDTGPRDLTQPDPGIELPRRIWTMAADGSQQRALAPDTDCRQERPLWSADDRQVLFACAGAEASVSLWLVPVDGGAATQVVADVSGPQKGTQPVLPSYQGHIEWDGLYDWWRP